MSHCFGGAVISPFLIESRRARRSVRNESRMCDASESGNVSSRIWFATTTAPGRLSCAFTEPYLKLCSILNGTRMKETCALPSAARSLGSQKRPSYKPYSIAIAVTCA